MKKIFKALAYNPMKDGLMPLLILIGISLLFGYAIENCSASVKGSDSKSSCEEAVSGNIARQVKAIPEAQLISPEKEYASIPLIKNVTHCNKSNIQAPAISATIKGETLPGAITAPARHASQGALIVKKGRAKAVIVLSYKAPGYIVSAAQDFQYHIKKSSGATLPIIKDIKLDTIPPGTPRIFIGCSKGTEKYNGITAGLPFEEFWIKTDGSDIYFLSNDDKEAPAVHYAVCEWLERTLQAKWLWPGDLGTVVDHRRSIALGSWNYHWRSPYDVRVLLGIGNRFDPDLQLWLTRQRIASRRVFDENYTYEHWEEKYGNQYLEILAQVPPKVKKAEPAEQKFNLSSLKLLDLIYQDWIDKGRPKIYPLTVTDGWGFDPRLAPNAKARAVYMGKVDLTIPYLEFRKRVLDYFKAKGVSDIRFDIQVYSQYYNYPDSFRWDGSQFNAFFTDLGQDSTNWRRWEATGARMYLRPNWWWNLPLMPGLHYKQEGNFFNFAKAHGMKGFFFDGLLNEWSLHGLDYYTIARLSYRDMTPEQVAEEYASAFGAAAGNVKKYLEAEQSYTKGFNKTELNKIVQKYKAVGVIKYNKLNVCPSLYPSEKTQEMRNLLSKGSKPKPGSEELRRLEWLESGLQLTDYAVAYVNKTYACPSVAADTAFIAQSDAIERTYPFSIVHSSLINILNRYDYYSRPHFKK